MKGTIDSSQLLHGGRDNVYVQSTNKDSLHMSSLQTPAAQEKIKDVTQIFYTNEDVRRDTGMNPISRASDLPQPINQDQRLGLVAPSVEKVEVIKVYLEARKQREPKQPSVKMLTDEVSQIQEVRYCLKTLREQMAARQNNNNNKVKDNQEESNRLREVTKRLYAQLKESEKKHQDEKERLHAESSEFRQRLDEQSERLQRAEGQAEDRGQRVEELQRLLGGMEVESAGLQDKMAATEAELKQLRESKEEVLEKERRSEDLEKQLAVQKEKIHHLDDMLKCHQRKVRHMIEQLQNSRTVIQERDRAIRDLEEKVAFLEAENREMHDQMEYFLGGQAPETQTSAEHKPQILFSKPLTPTTVANKSLPFIKVIEIKS
ncbi:tuftelin 1b isoform X2 [Hypomesus transpacificus]|uniref:tuftelin 1b isoform X2 n=1 Tax=Hypomesus transpacificus TaxID=137520 RepID=UPI001F0775A5|nr:tuftelin 1b isoform X2 [Hypomesus transpacificus]